MWDWSGILTAWLEVGLDEDAFWRSTPRQIERKFAAHNARLAREHNERAWLAWHIAALAHVPPKKLHQQYARLMHRDAKPRLERSPDEMWAIMSGMTREN